MTYSYRTLFEPARPKQQPLRCVEILKDATTRQLLCTGPFQGWDGGWRVWEGGAMSVASCAGLWSGRGGLGDCRGHEQKPFICSMSSDKCTLPSVCHLQERAKGNRVFMFMSKNTTYRLCFGHEKTEHSALKFPSHIQSWGTSTGSHV
jgi:hypothetical protein